MGIDLIRDYYDNRYRTLQSNAYRPSEAYEVFLRHLNVHSGGLLLDVGCGNGFLLSAAQALGLKAYGADISPEAVKVASMNAPGAEIRTGPADRLGYSDASFDYVTCIGVLEHCLDIDAALKEMCRVAKHGAGFCILVPNKKFLFWRSQFGHEGTEQVEISEHLFDLGGWSRILARNGLQVSKVYQDKWLAQNIRILASRNVLGIARRLLLKLMWGLMPLSRTYQFEFICKKHANYVPSEQQPVQ